MSAPKHTPGEWNAGTMVMTKTDWAALNTGHEIHIVKRGIDVIAAVWAVGDEEADNARLIAAAPDLLKALKHAVHWHDQLGKTDIAMMEAAIAKAIGAA